MFYAGYYDFTEPNVVNLLGIRPLGKGLRSGECKERWRPWRCGNSGFTPEEQKAIDGFPKDRSRYGCRGRHGRFDSPALGLRYSVGERAEVESLPDAPWPEPPARPPRAKGKPGTPCWPRMEAVRCPLGGYPEDAAILAEERLIESLGLNLSRARAPFLMSHPMSRHKLPTVSERAGREGSAPLTSARPELRGRRSAMAAQAKMSACLSNRIGDFKCRRSPSRICASRRTPLRQRPAPRSTRSAIPQSRLQPAGRGPGVGAGSGSHDNALGPINVSFPGISPRSETCPYNSAL